MSAEMMIRWVFLDETGGAPCQNGEVMTPQALDRIARIVSEQLARDYGCDSGARAGSGPDDVQIGERVYSFKAALPEAPQAVAYHSVDGAGVPYGMEAIGNCSSLYGLYGALMAASHEALETQGNPGCNSFSQDGQGYQHARERCDGCETQGYPIDLGDGGPVGIVANFFLEAWYIPGSAPPYTFMAAEAMTNEDAPGPMQIVPSGGGNYDVVEPDPGNETELTGAKALVQTESMRAMKHPARRVVGLPRNPHHAAHWSSRVQRILRGGGP